MFSGLVWAVAATTAIASPDVAPPIAPVAADAGHDQRTDDETPRSLRPEHARRRNEPVVAPNPSKAGALMLGLSHGTTITLGFLWWAFIPAITENDPTPHDNQIPLRLLIPVAGPLWVATEKGAPVTLLVLDGLFQATGVALIAYDVTNRIRRRSQMHAVLGVVPTHLAADGNGLAVCGRF
ncbi:MAG TPA: hypothetical protein VMU50_11990 [Polyangia bacterium]|nr:hypothetical protein [Polyangia bacterium]